MLTGINMGKVRIGKALEVGDLSLLENCSHRLAALNADAVGANAASAGNVHVNGR